MTARIEDVEKPVVGRWYMVPCVKVIHTFMPGYPEGSWVPVIGAAHEDSEIIGFADEHWHCDHRFFTDYAIQIGLQRGKGILPNKRRRQQITAAIARRPINVLNTTGEIAARRLRCRRQHITFPSAAAWMRALEAKYAETNARCGFCPHRGLPLAGAPVRDGARVCPGHGLGFDVVTGRLKPRKA